MKRQLLHSTKTHFHTLTYKGEAVICYEGKLQRIVGKYAPSLSGLFANIQEKEDTFLWTTGVFKEEPVPFSGIGDNETKLSYSLVLSQAIDQLSAFLATLPVTHSWHELIQLILSNLDKDYVFCGEGKVVIANWGLISKERKEAEGIYKKSFEQNNFIREIKKSQTDFFKNISEEELPVEKITPEEEQKKEVTETEEKEPESGIKPPETEKPVTPEKPEQKRPEKNQGSITDPPSVNGASPPAPLSGYTSYRKKPWWKRWWKLLLKILLLLALFLLFLSLLRQCNTRHSNGGWILPPAADNTIFPVDSAVFRYDKDSLKIIVADRLNVLLAKEESGSIEAFGTAFKALYPGNQYKIVYYDTLTYRLQLQVPVAEREQIREQLPLQLPQFDFLLFDESLFGTGLQFNDPAFRQEDYSWFMQTIQAYGAWQITTGNDSIIVAVVDNGFDLAHPELASKIHKPYNIVSRNSKVSPVNKQGQSGHGTHVAAIAVGKSNNGQGLAGIAPDCRLMPVQVATPENYTTTSALMDGILYAIYQGAHVVNISMGIGSSMFANYHPLEQLNYIENNGKEEEKVWDKIHQIASQYNCILVWAAGNENHVSGYDPSKRHPVGIKVSATNQQDQKALFSNYGNFSAYPVNYSTLSAPGVAIYSAVPGNSYQQMDGTSMAAPIVAGAVALMKSVRPDITAAEVIQILQKTGKPVYAPSTPVGNLLQLQNALLAVTGQLLPQQPSPPGEDDNSTTENCDQLSKRAQELLEELERIRQLCPKLDLSPDTLKIPEIIENPELLNGTWKSTSELFNVRTNEKIELYMQFTGSSGTLSIIEKNGEQYTAPLAISITGDQLNIRQLNEARNHKNEGYVKYTFAIRQDKRGVALCESYISSRPTTRVNFNLIKIK